jgi:protein TonB
MAKQRIFRWFSAMSFMLVGAAVVLSTLVFINRLSQAPDKDELLAQSQVNFERKQKPKEQVKPKPKPKPKPRKPVRSPPNPLAGLGSNLSGINFGLPGFDAQDLAGLNDELTGAGEGLVMTDDTVDQPPQAVYQSPMQYPARAKAKGVRGYVVLSLLIGVTGEIEQIKVVESVPEGVFDETALTGVSQWQFEPAQYQGKSVRAWAKQRVRFDLSGA